MTEPLVAIDFLHLGVIDILDIISVSALIYFVIRLIRRSMAMNLFVAVCILVLLRIAVSSLGMQMMSAVLATVFDVGIIAIVIIFQPEIRRFLFRFGSGNSILNDGRKEILRILGLQRESLGSEAINEITDACFNMSEQKTGALIVLPSQDQVGYIRDTGDTLDARISHRLIENIFFKNSPLHDGAMIINNDRIVAARCTLPITSRTDIPASMGMRHKAAIGLSEESDARVIVVSEQTGRVSFVVGGNVQKVSNKNELKLLLGANLTTDAKEDNGAKE